MAKYIPVTSYIVTNEPVIEKIRPALLPNGEEAPDNVFIGIYGIRDVLEELHRALHDAEKQGKQFYRVDLKKLETGEPVTRANETNYKKISALHLARTNKALDAILFRRLRTHRNIEDYLCAKPSRVHKVFDAFPNLTSVAWTMPRKDGTSCQVVAVRDLSVLELDEIRGYHGPEPVIAYRNDPEPALLNTQGQVTG